MAAGEIVDLGFDVRCNSFAIEFYPKRHAERIHLKPDRLRKWPGNSHRDIEVNDPAHL